MRCKCERYDGEKAMNHNTDTSVLSMQVACTQFALATYSDSLALCWNFKHAAKHHLQPLKKNPEYFDPVTESVNDSKSQDLAIQTSDDWQRRYRRCAFALFKMSNIGTVCLCTATVTCTCCAMPTVLDHWFWLSVYSWWFLRRTYIVPSALKRFVLILVRLETDANL